MKKKSKNLNVITNKSYIISWDTRDESHKATHNVQAHNAEINCVGFSPGNEWVLATGSSDKVSEMYIT